MRGQPIDFTRALKAALSAKPIRSSQPFLYSLFMLSIRPAEVKSPERLNRCLRKATEQVS